MKINIIAACDKNGIIGINGKIPWHIPEDLKRFKSLTIGHAVIMGRKTWESLPVKPFPDRFNVIVSSKKLWAEHAERNMITSLNDAVAICDDFAHTQVFIIGGEQLYREALPLADRVYLTLVDQETPIADGDEVSRFPLVDLMGMISKDILIKTNHSNNAGYEFIEFVRK